MADNLTLPLDLALGQVEQIFRDRGFCEAHAAEAAKEFIPILGALFLAAFDKGVTETTAMYKEFINNVAGSNQDAKRDSGAPSAVSEGTDREHRSDRSNYPEGKADAGHQPGTD